MKHHVFHRLAALALCLVLLLSLLGGVTVFADDEIWTEEPTGWINWGHVSYKTAGDYILNWGVRGELCRFRSQYALDFYPDLNDGQGMGWGYDIPGLYPGGSSEADAADSALYAYLHSFLAGKQTHKTSYAETRDLYRYTDCMVSNSNYISSFYSGIRLNGAWDGGSTWNREHTWPKSKSTGDQESDIMMLRPTSVAENSGRGNLAYGESQGFYNPNSEAGTTGFDLRGDCARICLYCYVRWSENAGSMWGAEGVMESLDVLLDWMEQDPVDTWEMGRNDAVESITGVRNCFVDYPELAWYLFGRSAPEDYPTPFKGDHNDFVSAPACILARSSNEEWGTVDLKGWAVDCFPAEGYYASGYELWSIDGEMSLEEDPTVPLRWENGRLLYFPTTEADYLVEIHFFPIGQTDPCPIGHCYDNWDPELIETLQWPTCTEYGKILVPCSHCGKKGVIFSAPPLGHVMDEGEVTKEPTIDEPGQITYTCVRCDWTYTEELPFRFKDVKKPEDYYYIPVYWAVEQGITGGTDATHFSPNKPCTRAEIVTFLWAAMGSPAPAAETGNPFKDVKKKDYFYSAVLWALENGVTGGVDDSHFSPKKVCTRAEVVSFLWAMGSKTMPESGANPFRDVKKSKFYYNPVLWAVEHGITGGTGDGSTFSPNMECTRAQIVTFLYKAMTNPELQFCHHEFVVAEQTPATCTEVGKRVTRCVLCGYEVTRTEKQLQHDFQFERVIDDPDGFFNYKQYYAYRCSHCRQVRLYTEELGSYTSKWDLEKAMELGNAYAASKGCQVTYFATLGASSYSFPMEVSDRWTQEKLEARVIEFFDYQLEYWLYKYPQTPMSDENGRVLFDEDGNIIYRDTLPSDFDVRVYIWYNNEYKETMVAVLIGTWMSEEWYEGLGEP